MVGRVIAKARFATLLLRIAGPTILLVQLKRQIYSRGVFLGLEKDLRTDGYHVTSGVDYRLGVASPEDIQEVFENAKRESRESAIELIQRIWFYDAGFHNCYVARTADSNELCYMQWMLSCADSDLIVSSFDGKFPRLGDDEVLLENAYTFEKFRGKRVMPAVELELADIARQKGFKRMITYVREDNIASLKGCERAGFKVFERVLEGKLLFFGGRKHPKN